MPGPTGGGRTAGRVSRYTPPKAKTGRFCGCHRALMMRRSGFSSFRAALRNSQGPISHFLTHMSLFRKSCASSASAKSAPCASQAHLLSGAWQETTIETRGGAAFSGQCAQASEAKCRTGEVHAVSADGQSYARLRWLNQQSDDLPRGIRNVRLRARATQAHGCGDLLAELM